MREADRVTREGPGASVYWTPTDPEYARCCEIAAERVRRANGRERFAYADREGRELAGVIGERAAALALGYREWWPTVDTFGEASDLPGGEQVRARRMDWHDLPLAPEDKKNADRPWILVVPHTSNTVRVVGWIMGHDAMQPRYWNEKVPHPCWMVPQRDLHPIEELA